MTVLPPMSGLGLAALEYACELGWAVFPLQPRGKDPAWSASEMKDAAGDSICKGGFYRASSHPEQICSWWDELPDANIGLWPGPSGLLVIDVDGPDAEAEAERLNLPALAMRISISGRADGGRHLYFPRPAQPVRNKNLAGSFLTIRCDGGYVVIPPSVHPDTGREYRWAR